MFGKIDVGRSATIAVVNGFGLFNVGLNRTGAGIGS